MKTIKSLLAVSVLVATGAANAASYDFSGTGSTVATNYGMTLANLVWTGSGTVDDTGGVFNSGSFSYTQNVTSPLDSSVNANITGTMTVDATGAVVDTYSNCTGTASVCNSVAPSYGVPQNYQANPYNFSNLASLTWTVTSYSSAPGFGPTKTVANYTANFLTPTPPPAVPVPAAAWLFGSALLGLAGTARRRNKVA